MNYLFIVAHPDDEILGACGTIMRLKEEQHRVAVLLFSQNSKTRESGLSNKVASIHKELGIDATYILDYEMMKFDKYDRYRMTRDIEMVIMKEKADTLFIHDLCDIHNDHRELSQISIEASKLPLRKPEYSHHIKSIYTMEIPSSTDWGSGFIPNSYVEISEEAIAKKAVLLEEYDDVIRPVPHPRNKKSFEALARYRGGQAGVRYAEAFKKIFEVIK